MVTKAPSRLTALDFERDVQRLTQDFTGRAWVLAEIDNWLQQGQERFFILSGEPGVGKSAIAAQLIRVRDDVAAYHFCIAGRNSTIRPATALRSLAAQLGEHLPGYGEALVNTIKPFHFSVQVDIDVNAMTGGEITGVVINHLHASDPEEELDILLRDPLRALPAPPAPVLILIDSLDEAMTYRGDVNLVTLLAKVADLPPWVRLLCTSRPERRVLRYFDGLSPYVLDAESPRNRDDVRQYVARRVARQEMRARLQEAGVEPEALTDHVTELSDGNFLYTRVLLNDVQAGRQPLDDLAALPGSLDEVYHGFLGRFTVSEWQGRYQPLFGMLAVAQEPISEAQLASFTGLRRGRLRQYLGVVGQFLDQEQREGGQSVYALFHQSLRDYLLDEARNQDFWCAPEDEHQGIADYYLKTYRDRWSDCDRYGLRHLPTHLDGAEQIEPLRQLLLDFDWLQAKLDATDVPSLGADCDLLADDASLRWLHDALWLSAHVLAQDKTQLAGQLHGRLLSYQDPDLRTMLEQARRQKKTPWLRPLIPSLKAPDEMLRYTLTGHRSTVRSVAVTPDGKRAISGAMDGKLIVWDLERKTDLYSLEGHQDQIYAVALTPDGERAVSASNDQTIMVWDLENRTRRLTLTGHEGPVRAVAVTSDGQRVISSSTDGTVRVWDLASGQLLHTLPGHDGYYHAIAATPDGKKAVIALGSQLAVWDLETMRKRQVLDGHDDVVAGVTMTPDGRRIISASYDRTLKVWDISTELDTSLESGVLLRTLHGHEAGVNGVAVTPDGRWAVSASEDFTLIVWDISTELDTGLESGEPVRRLVDHTENVKAVAVTPDGETAISASSDTTLKIWDLKDKVELPLPARDDPLPPMARVMPDGNRTLSVSDDHALVMWDLERRTALFTLAGHTARVNQVVVTPDGQRAVSASEDQTLRVWGLEARTALFALTGHAKGVYAVAVTPDGRRAASVTWDGAVRVWNLEQGAELYTLPGQVPGIAQLVLAPDAQHIIFVSHEGDIGVWDREAGASAISRQPHADGPLVITRRVAYVTPYRGWAIFSVDDHHLKVVNLERLAETHTLSCDHPEVVALTPDGRRAVAVSQDNTLTRWDMEGGGELSFPTGHSWPVTGVAVSPDGRYAATVAGFGFHKMGGAPDRTLKVWDISTELGTGLESGRLVASFTGESALRDCAVVEDGVTFVAGPHILRLEGRR